MRPCVWITGHSIADTVGSQVRAGLDACHLYYTKDLTPEIIDAHDVHIGYGILRGMDKVFRACDAASKPWFNIDRGYWKPGHYDGYYRISLRGTQQTKFDGLKHDYERWDRLGIDILTDQRCDEMPYSLICPPTDYAADFFGLSQKQWHHEAEQYSTDCIWFDRLKTANKPLQKDLDGANKVITFNSSVGWEALRQGIEVISDPTHSIVGAYQKKLDKPIHADLNARRELFALMASLELTLDEIRSGLLWPLIQNLMNTHVSLSGV